MANWEAEMTRNPRAYCAPAAIIVALIIANLSIADALPQTSTTPSSAPKPASSSTTQATPKTGTGTTTRAAQSGPRAMTNRDVIQMVQAKISDDIVIALIEEAQ